MTSWTFDSTQIDSVEWGSPPNIRRGQTTSVVLQFHDGSDYESRYKTVREYLDYAGTTRRGIRLDGTPWFQEDSPSGAKQQVVPLYPGSSIRLRPGFWGVIDGGTDLSRKPGGLAIEVEFFVLALYGEYDDITGIRNDLSGSVVA